MRKRALLSTAFGSLGKNRMRSLLTVLGVVIGVAAVIVMVAIGRGAQLRVEAQISALGHNLLTILPGASRFGGVSRGAGSAGGLDEEDAQRLREEADLLMAVSPAVRVSSQLVAIGSNWQSTVYGVNPEYLQIRSWTVAQGEAFDDRDELRRSRVCLLGRTVVTNLFGESDPVGSRIRIGKVPFTVVGVLEAKGQSGFGQDQDDVVLAPFSTVLTRLAGGRNVNQIYVSVRDDESSQTAEAQVREILRQSHRLAESEEDDFRIRSQAEIANTMAQTTGTFTLLLASIAGVSLLVGGIGIMNIMLVSVTERTREIGIRLAVGARRRDVLAQFLVEAIALSLAGGLLGVALAVGLATLATRLFPITAVIEPSIVLLSLAFAVLIGIFFGFHPARRAAGLDPIEALRYE